MYNIPVAYIDMHQSLMMHLLYNVNISYPINISSFSQKIGEVLPLI